MEAEAALKPSDLPCPPRPATGPATPAHHAARVASLGCPRQRGSRRNSSLRGPQGRRLGHQGPQRSQGLWQGGSGCARAVEQAPPSRAQTQRACAAALRRPHPLETQGAASVGLNKQARARVARSPKESLSLPARPPTTTHTHSDRSLPGFVTGGPRQLQDNQDSAQSPAGSTLGLERPDRGVMTLPRRLSPPRVALNQ